MKFLVTLLVGLITFLYILDMKNPYMIDIQENDAVRVYPTKECRRNTIFEYKNSNLEELDGYGTDSTEIILRDYFEGIYYKNCAPQKNSICHFKYYGDPINPTRGYMIDIEFNPESYYATCYDKPPIYKTVKVPLFKWPGFLS